MIELQTSQGITFLIDAEDFPRVSAFTWCWEKGRISRHVGRTAIPQRQGLHQFLLEGDGQESVEIDHINRNPLDNRKSNLRRSNRSQQAINQGIRRDNSTGVKGVSCKRPGQWMAYLDVGCRRLYLYSGKSFEEAVNARRRAEETYHKPILMGSTG